MVAEPLKCDLCERSDGGPFAWLTWRFGLEPLAPDAERTFTQTRTVCKRCCDERGIPVVWGPSHTIITTYRPDDAEPANKTTCPDCAGAGQRWQHWGWGTYDFDAVDCARCGGTGKVAT